MEVFLQYKELILLAAASIFEIIILLVFKRRPQVIDNSFVAKLCDWILEAESVYKLGSDKKEYVLSKAKDYLGSNFSYNQVSELIEYVLSIPEKKGK